MWNVLANEGNIYDERGKTEYWGKTDYTPMAILFIGLFCPTLQWYTGKHYYTDATWSASVKISIPESRMFSILDTFYVRVTVRSMLLGAISHKR